MSVCKPSEAELVAIYRLEFYKKQKHWKLYSRDHKKFVEKPHTLNTTYDVEDDSDPKETLDPLNIAFVDSGHDETSTCDRIEQKSLKSQKLSLEWQDSVNIWPYKTKENNQITNKDDKSRLTDLKKAEKSAPECCEEKPTKNFAMYRLQQLQKAASLTCFESKVYPMCFEHATDIWQDDDDSVDHKWNYQAVCDELKHDHKCTSQALPLLGDKCMEQESLSPDLVEMDFLNGKYCDEPEAWSPRAKCPYSFPSGILDGEDCSTAERSADSVGEFMRGADAAPHSSEVDLSLPPTVDVHDVSFASLARLSSRQLAHAVLLHLRVMRRLLLESEHRRKLRQLLKRSSQFNSFEEYPTRDIGPSPPDDLLKNMFHKDEIIAGSHWNKEADLCISRGRGRGRRTHF